MFGVVVVVFPIMLLGLMLGMERVERPLDVDKISVELERFLDSTSPDVRPDDVEAHVSETYATALERYWRRRRARAFRRPRGRSE